MNYNVLLLDYSDSALLPVVAYRHCIYNFVCMYYIYICVCSTIRVCVNWQFPAFYIDIYKLLDLHYNLHAGTKFSNQAGILTVILFDGF